MRLQVAASLLFAGLAIVGTARAAGLKSVAILTPEQGNDFGWNQQGIAALRAAAAKAGVTPVVAENLGYGDVRPTLRELAEDGAGLIIAHASGYNTAAPEIAAETQVPVAITDRPSAVKLGLVADYTMSGHQGAYLAGRLAAKMTRTGTVGIVVSGEPPGWNSQSAAFATGARAEKPGIAIRYAVIGPAAYSDAAGGERVAKAVIGAGADVIFGQGDGSSFGMLQATETTKAVDGGTVWFIDVIGDKSSLDKGTLLSSVVWNLTPVFTDMIEDVKAGTFGQHGYGIKLADDSVGLLKTGHIPPQVWSDLQAIRGDVISGKIRVDPQFGAEAVHALVQDVPAR